MSRGRRTLATTTTGVLLAVPASSTRKVACVRSAAASPQAGLVGERIVCAAAPRCTKAHGADFDLTRCDVESRHHPVYEVREDVSTRLGSVTMPPPVIRRRSTSPRGPPAQPIGGPHRRFPRRGESPGNAMGRGAAKGPTMCMAIDDPWTNERVADASSALPSAKARSTGSLHTHSPRPSGPCACAVRATLPNCHRVHGPCRRYSAQPSSMELGRWQRRNRVPSHSLLADTNDPQRPDLVEAPEQLQHAGTFLVCTLCTARRARWCDNVCVCVCKKNILYAIRCAWTP